MDPTEVWPWLVDTFGEFAVVIGAIALLVKYLLPKYEESRQELIDAYKAQLEEAKKAIQEANEERKQVTDKYLNAMSTFVVHTNEILSQLVEEIRELKKQAPGCAGAESGPEGESSEPAKE